MITYATLQVVDNAKSMGGLPRPLEVAPGRVGVAYYGPAAVCVYAHRIHGLGSGGIF
jgi:hypothetical protein